MSNKTKSLILYAPEVRRILEHGSAVVVRAVNPQPKNPIRKGDDGNWYDADCINPGVLVKCPFGAVGEERWVAEEYYCDLLDWINGNAKDRKRLASSEDHIIDLLDHLYYHADGECCDLIPECSCGEVGPVDWLKPGRMPQPFSRLTVTVASVVCKCLNEITFEEVIGAGTEQASAVPYGSYQADTIEAFRDEWDARNRKTPWASNPWVFVATVNRKESK